jgi:predicted enzyme related to lactoylglutathione lyase
MSADLKWPNWLGVVVDDMAVARRVYADVLGLKEFDAGQDWVQFDLGFPNILELLARSGAPEYNHTRFQPGFAVVDIEAARDRLVGVGAEAITDIRGGPPSQGYWSYFRDPEGNVFEVSQRLGERWGP